MQMHFVIIGNGVTGITAAMAIRARESGAQITIVGGESDYFFSRTALMYAYMDRLTPRDLEPYERKVYDRQSFQRLRDRVTDLDASTGTLRLRSGKSIHYDRLLLATGSAPNSIPWSGLEQVSEGIVNFVTMQDLEKCERLTPSTREAVVVGGGLIGVELVECLSFHRRKVTFLVREPWYWPVALDGPEAEMISEHLRRHGVDLRVDDEVTAVAADGSGRVSGVRTKSGAEFPCQMLGVTAGVHPNVDWLRDVTTPPLLGRGIQVNPAFETSIENVWAAGDCAEIVRTGEKPFVEQIWYSAKRQGELAARAMLGDRIDYRQPTFYNSSKFFEIEFTTVGIVNAAPPGAFHFYSRIPGKDVSVRIVEHRGAVIGFNMLGSRWDHTFFERWIAERRALDYAVAHLHEAQFDVEFGRQELSQVRAEYAGVKLL
jgi:NADPH-dependent 2,4-dienoyl-CoA reductase/sulfur reductase-like enzyme